MLAGDHLNTIQAESGRIRVEYLSVRGKMTTTSQIEEGLVEELEALRQRVAELEELEAKHNGEKEALEESAEKLKTIVENTHDVILCAHTPAL